MKKVSPIIQCSMGKLKNRSPWLCRKSSSSFNVPSQAMVSWYERIKHIKCKINLHHVIVSRGTFLKYFDIVESFSRELRNSKAVVGAPAAAEAEAVLLPNDANYLSSAVELCKWIGKKINKFLLRETSRKMKLKKNTLMVKDWRPRSLFSLNQWPIL